MIDVSKPMIQVDGLVKRYGRLEVLKELCLQVNRRQVTAIVGHNGSGKTTLIKALLGLVKPEAGRIFFDGHKLNGDFSYREQIGYMPQVACFPENLRTRELLSMLKDVRGNPADLDEELLDQFDLAGEMDKRLKYLSGGNRQKVSAVIAFLFKPKIVIMDEPTAGLDPIASSLLKDKILKEKDRGVTFILTSHIMSEIDALADHIAFLLDGRVYVEGEKEAIRQRAGHDDLERAIAQLMQEAVA